MKRRRISEEEIKRLRGQGATVITRQQAPAKEAAPVTPEIEPEQSAGDALAEAVAQLPETTRLAVESAVQKMAETNRQLLEAAARPETATSYSIKVRNIIRKNQRLDSFDFDVTPKA